MKTAILISGELRTFSICRPTMTFLDDLNADIYVSTWDRTIVKNERINLFINDEVSEDNILKILNRPATVMVEPVSCVEEKKYNTKMIHRWLAGFQMILDSEQDYDYVMVIRPDLFFNCVRPSMFTLDSLIADGDKQFAWHEEGHKLQDNLFFAKFETMKELFSRLSIKDWEDANVQDWHTYWTKFVGWTEIKRLGGHVPFTFCRPLVKEGMNFQDVYKCYLDWRDMQIMAQIEIGKRAIVVKDWGEAEVLKAEAKSFEHYKIKNKVALIITGMLRNYDAAALSLHIWGNADRYLCTWESAGQQAIEEYSKMANIKEKFIIDDSDLDSVTSKVNILRMVYLWEQAANVVPKGYDKYIILRPDGFYFTHKVGSIEQLIFRSPCISANSVSLTTRTVSDNILILDSMAYLSRIHSEIRSTYLTRSNARRSTCIHYMLFEILIENQRIDMQYVDLENTIFPVFVRDTFKLTAEDKYDWHLYFAIFCDSAVWWRKNVQTAFHGRLVPEY